MPCGIIKACSLRRNRLIAIMMMNIPVSSAARRSLSLKDPQLCAPRLPVVYPFGNKDSSEKYREL